MLWNLYDAQENSSAVISSFKGLNRRHKGSNGEFLEMKNMSSRSYPCLAPRLPREQIMEGYKNIRLLIPPINKTLNDEIPAFCGIADDKDGRSVFYYNGEKVKINQDEFSTGYINDESGLPNYYPDNLTNYDGSTSPYDGRYNDMSELFPKGEGTQLSYCYFNNRLFIFVNNTESFGDVSSLKVKEIKGAEITLNEEVNSDLAAKILHRNIILWSRGVENHYQELKYYVTDVTVGAAGAAKITVNENICTNPYNLSVIPGVWTVEPMYDRGKYCFDAGKTGTRLCNAEKGLYNVAVGVNKESYTDEVLGLTYESCCCLKSEDIDFSKTFDKGDRVKLDNFLYEENNTLIIDSDFESAERGRAVTATVVGIESGSENSMYIQMRDTDGKIVKPRNEADFSTNQGHVYNPFRSITKILPNMNSVVSHNQRLWGTAANGEYYYASAVSDPFTWFGGTYGTASGPQQFSSGTKDEYKGLVDYSQYVILLKPTSIQQVYALASSSSVSVARAQYNVGCIDINSAIVVGSTLYYLGYNGFYRYSGSEPELISSKLNTKYVSAHAVTDGVKYYASAVTSSGETEFLVYDAQYDIWHKEDDLRVTGGYMWYDKPIAAAGDTVYCINAADGGEAVDWYAESVIMFEGTLDNKALNELWIRAYIPLGETITLYTSTNFMTREDIPELKDKPKWREHTALKGMGDIKVYRVSVRAENSEYYKFALAGTGDCVVYDIERKLHINGRPYGK